MKLQQLIIKNLASIEEATIDFEQGPLAEESIFLICGETGAGKSTILDAICLALYNDTPRMQRSPKEKYMDLARSFSDKKEEINIDDVRQLMRRNTAEARVELSFIGSNEIPYLARWYVAKARKKVDGNIQKVAWTLTNRKTGEELKKVKEVEDEIQRCIGLNFEQFCRTTLLAQGEFTRFLQSREADKSEILEKLTGTDIYSRIGMKIYDITKQKKEAYDLQHQRIAATHLLSEEEKATLLTSLEQLKQDCRQQETIAKELNRKHEWLRQELEYHKTRQEHQIQLEAIESRIHSDEYRKQNRLIQEWDVTTDARKLLKENKERQDEITRQMQEEQQYLQQFIRLSEGMLQEEEKIRSWQQEENTIRQYLELQQPFADMFAQSQTILTHLQNILNTQSQEKKRKVQLEQEKTRLPQLEEACTRQANLLKSEREKGEQLDALLQQMNRQYQEMNMPARQAESKRLSEQEMQLTKTVHALQAFSAAQQVLQEAQKAEQETAVKLEGAKQQHRLLKEKETSCQKVFDEAEKLYEKQKECTEQWAAEARSRLQPGDICPVCGQRITELPSDENFRSLLEPVHQHLLEKKKQLEEVMAEIAQNTAYGKSLATLFQQNQRQTTLAEKNCQQAQSEAIQQSKLAGHEEISSDIIAEIPVRQDEIHRKQDDVNRQIKQAQTLLEAISKQQKLKDQQQKAIEQFQNALNQAEKKRTEQINKIQTLQELIRNDQESAAHSLQTAREQISWPEWETDWHASPDDFMLRLKQEASVYTQQQKREEVLVNQRNLAQRALDEMKSLQQQIRDEYPQWVIGMLHPQPVQVLTKDWSQLFAHVKALHQSQRHTRELQEKGTQALQNFLHQHPEFTQEKLEQLTAFLPEQIQSWREDQQKQNESRVAVRAKLELVLQQIKQHQDSKPELEEEVSLERLKEQYEEQNRIIQDFNQQIGQKQNLLDENRKNEERLQGEKAIEEKLKLDYQKWERLRFYFGDQQGKTFRNIAQSFVLKELLHGANYYLKRLTDRYELECQAGSLTILLRDFYQGGTARPASTLSGGESFLVSLALALGLSSISQQSLSVNTLFIDEGFGTLSEGYLQTVMDTLEKLHQLGGKKVGIISHVSGLRERIKAQIQVRRIDNSRSEIVTLLDE